MEHIGKVLLDYLTEKCEAMDLPVYIYDIPEGATVPCIMYEATNLVPTENWYNYDNFLVRVHVFADTEAECIKKSNDLSKIIKKGEFINKTDKGNADVDPVVKGVAEVVEDEELGCFISYQDFEILMSRVV